jgi:hypothetical protein
VSPWQTEAMRGQSPPECHRHCIDPGPTTSHLSRRRSGCLLAHVGSNRCDVIHRSTVQRRAIAINALKPEPHARVTIARCQTNTNPKRPAAQCARAAKGKWRSSADGRSLAVSLNTAATSASNAGKPKRSSTTDRAPKSRHSRAIETGNSCGNCVYRDPLCAFLRSGRVHHTTPRSPQIAAPRRPQCSN